ncbi:LuxR C-terminal-related transcriptional regulator [Corallococcus sp. EGB]|uniref:helix-turn-helix transcriptional regulator n=1 Tax=Corallococcus sp. EGB TaxID=1521117 RepID=UPI001CBC6412|nr:LuxR C-terminal-related transcriptional regulator [Corallococcus sp. EGB]
MFNPMQFTPQELMLRDSVIAALNSSLSLPQVLEASRPTFLEFTQSDAMGLCLMRLKPTLDFRWHVPGHPVLILNEYSGVAEHDFMRQPIFDRPNMVIRDSQILTRDQYQRSLIWQRSHELNQRLEHVSAVLLPIRKDLVGALAFYRFQPRAFSSENANAISSLTAHLVNAVRNCNDVEKYVAGAQLLEELHNRPDCAFVIVEPASHEVYRSPRAANLLERWFRPSELHSSGLPGVFTERLDALIPMDADTRLGKTLWVVNHPEGYRTCRFIELPAAEGPRRWALLLSELPHAIPLPFEMQRQLTPRQIDIAKGVLRNWSNGQIADELKISGQTVKTHVRDLFDRLGVDNRNDFLYQAARLNRPV